MAKTPVPDEATIPVRSVGVVTLYADSHGILLYGDGGRIRDVQTIHARCYSCEALWRERTEVRSVMCEKNA